VQLVAEGREQEEEEASDFITLKKQVEV